MPTGVVHVYSGLSDSQGMMMRTHAVFIKGRAVTPTSEMVGKLR